VKVVFLSINLVLISFIGLSQSTEKIKLGVTFSHQSYFSNDIISSSYEGYAIDQSEFNYSIGVTALLFLNNRFSLVTGLAYSNKDFTGTYYCDVCDFAIAPQPELIKLRYVEVPVSVRYFLHKGNARGFIEGGLVNSFSANENLSGIYSSFLEHKKFILSGLIGLGLKAKLAKRIDVSGSLFLQQSLNGTFSNSEFKYQSVGIATTVARQL
jgi:hypothetical protein